MKILLNKNKIFILLFTIVINIQIFGQDIYSLIENPNIFFENNVNYRIDLDLNYFANSNSITNSFIDAAFSNKLIEEQQKQDVNSKLKSNNRLGYKLEYGGQFTFTTKANQYQFRVGVKSQEHLYSSFSANIFNLVFSGNKQFAGESIELSPFNYKYYSFEKISFGINNLYSNNNILLGADLSLIKGSRYQDADLKNAQFYTSSSGDSIILDTDTKVVFTYNNKTKLSSFNGYGLSLDINFFYLLNENSNDFVSAKIKDFGFVKWNNLTQYTVNNSFSFEGIEIDNLINSSDSSLSGLGSNSLGSMLKLDTNNVNKVLFIPTSIEVIYLKHINDKISVSPGIKYLLHSRYIPKIYTSVNFSLPWNITVSPIFSLGGYSKFDYGLGIQKVQFGKYSIGLFTYFIEDIIFPSNSTSQGFRIFASVFL